MSLGLKPRVEADAALTLHTAERISSGECYTCIVIVRVFPPALLPTNDHP